MDACRSFSVLNEACFRRGDTPAVVQATSYTASGIPAQGLAVVADRHMHTGKPWQNLGGLAWYDNRARWYDPVTMRFTAPDPLAEKYPGITPWAFCRNNPINVIDPTGKIVEDPDGYIQNLSLFYANSYRGMKNYIAANPNMGKKDRALLYYCAALYYSKAMELGALEASDQIYRIEQSNSLDKGTAYTFFDPESRKIITKINMPINDANGLVAHENEHWHQFEVGELSYDLFTGDAGFLYDMIDEINSYNIQSVVEDGIFFKTYDLKKNKIPYHLQYLMSTKEASKNTKYNIFRFPLTVIQYGKKTTVTAGNY